MRWQFHGFAVRVPLEGLRMTSYTGATFEQEHAMPKMSDQRRKRIQAKLRKIENASSRAAKIAKKARNGKA
jgi:phage-related minor tail protein